MVGIIIHFNVCEVIYYFQWTLGSGHLQVNELLTSGLESL